MPGHTPAEKAKNTGNTHRGDILPVGRPVPLKRRVTGKPRTLPSRASTKARPGVPSQASGVARGKLSELFKNR